MIESTLVQLKKKETYIHNHPLAWWRGHLYLVILKEFSNYIRGRVLDLGANWGYFTILFAGDCEEIFGVDINQKALRRGIRMAKTSNVHFINAIGSHLPFPTDFFDSAFAFSIFEHLSRGEMQATLTELARLIKPRGYLLVIVPRAGDLEDRRRQQRAYDPNHLQFFYTPKNILQALSHQRFRIMNVQHEDRHNPIRPSDKPHDHYKLLLQVC